MHGITLCSMEDWRNVSHEVWKIGEMVMFGDLAVMQSAQETVKL